MRGCVLALVALALALAGSCSALHLPPPPFQPRAPSTPFVEGGVPGFEAGSATITQNGVNDAPLRYAQFLVQAVASLESVRLPDTSSSMVVAAPDEPLSCSNEWYILGSQATDKRYTLDPASVRVTLGIFSATVVGKVAVHLDVPAFIRACRRFIFCFCSTVCQGVITVDTVLDLTTEWTFAWNQATNTLSASVKPTTQAVDTNIGGCHPAGWLSWFTNVQRDLDQAFAQEVAAAAASMARNWNLPHTFSPLSGVTVTYNVTDIEWTTPAYVSARANASLTTLIPGGSSVTYLADRIDSVIAPPLGWPARAANDTALILLSGLRTSSTLLSAWMWVAKVTGAASINVTARVLDANLTMYAIYDPPKIGFPASDAASIAVRGGYGYGVCRDLAVLNGPPIYVTVFNATFADLNANGTVTFLQRDGDTGLALRVDAIDTSAIVINATAPKLPLPKTVVDAIIDKLVVLLQPTLNKWLQANPFMLPSNLAPLAPNPIVVVKNEGTSLRPVHGYVDVSSYCRCGQPDPWWAPCHFACSPQQLHTQRREQRALARGPHQGGRSRGAAVEALFAGRRNATKKHRRTPRDEPLIPSLHAQVFTRADCSIPATSVGVTLIEMVLESGLCQPFEQLPELRYLWTGTALFFGCTTASCNASSCKLVLPQVHRGVCYNFASEFGASLTLDACFGDSNPNAPVNDGSSNAPPPFPYALVSYGDDACVSPVAMYALGSALGSCVQSPNDQLFYGTQVLPGPAPQQVVVQVGCQTPNCTMCDASLTTFVGTCASRAVLFSPSMVPHCVASVDFQHGLLVGLLVVGLFVAATLIIALWTLQRRGFFRADRPPPSEVTAALAAAAQEGYVDDVFERAQAAVLVPQVALEPMAGKSAPQESPVRLALGRVRDHVWSVVTRNLGYRPLEPREVWWVALGFAAALSGVPVGIVWARVSPLAIFSTQGVAAIGIPPTVLSSVVLEATFTQWSAASAYCILAASLVSALLSVMLRFGLRRPDKSHWQIVRAFCAISWILVAFVLLCIPMLIVRFGTLIFLEPDPGNFIQSNPDVRADVNVLIGTAFSSILLSYFSVLILTYAQPLICATLIATCAVMLSLDAAKLERLRSAIILLCRLPLLGPLVAMLPMFVLAQTLGASALWASSWVAMWLGSAAVGEALQYAVKQPALPRRLVYIAGAVLIVIFAVPNALIVQAGGNWLTDETSFLAVVFCSFAFAIASCVALGLNSIRVPVDLLPSADAGATSDDAETSDDDSTGRVAPIPDKLALNADESASLLHGEESVVAAEAPVASDAKWWWRLWDAVIEGTEQHDPVQYGHRISLRRVFLGVGSLCYMYSASVTLSSALHLNVRAALQNALQAIGINLDWPPGDTVFDAVFAEYARASLIQAILGMVGGVFFLLAFLWDAAMRSKRGLRVSRWLGYVGGVAVFFSIVCLAVPDYVSRFPIDLVVPFCATRFNHAVQTLLHNSFGIVFSSLFTWQLFPVIISVAPSLARASTLLLVHPSVKADLNVLRSLRALIVASTMLTVPITALPLLVFFQLTGTTTCTLLILAFWCIPVLFIAIAYMVTTGGARAPYKTYLLWLALYLLLLLALAIYDLVTFGFLRWILDLLKSADVYFALVAEVGLCNVLLGDILFSSLFE